MTKFFFKFKKPLLLAYFWSTSLIFGGQKIFPKKLACTTWYGFLVPCPNLEKPNDPIPRKQPYREQDGRMDRPYFMGPFWLLLEVQQVKDIEYNVSLTKNYCLTASMQKVSWIHALILQIKQILGSHELNGHATMPTEK